VLPKAQNNTNTNSPVTTRPISPPDGNLRQNGQQLQNSRKHCSSIDTILQTPKNTKANLSPEFSQSTPVDYSPICSPPDIGACSSSDVIVEKPIAATKTVANIRKTNVPKARQNSAKVKSGSSGGIQRGVQSNNGEADNFHVNAAHPFGHLIPTSSLSLDVKLTDIPLKDFAFVMNFISSAGFIAEKYVSRIRSAYILVMQNLIEKKDDELLWKKMLLLPVVLLSITNKSIMKKNIEKVLEDVWDFKIGQFVQSGDNAFYNVNTKDKNQNDWTTAQKLAYKCVVKGNFSKGMQSLLNDGPNVPNSEQTFQKLQSKHPQSDWTATEEELQQLHEFALPDHSAVDEVDFMQMRTVIQKCKKLVRPGLDKLRYEHLRTLVGYGAEPSDQEAEFSRLFAKIITFVLRGEIPHSISLVLSENELIALPKSDTDVRPIGIGSTIRKVAALMAFKQLDTFNDDHFSTLQYGLKQSGIEHVVHKVSIVREKHPDWDLFALDADNAFNGANRVIGLQQVAKHAPQVFPFLKEMYLHASTGWYRGLADGIKSVNSYWGFHQGDVLASWLYMLTIHPLLLMLHEKISEEFPEVASQYLNCWYVDDGNIVAPRPIMIRLVQLLREHGPRYGYIIKSTKGSYLMGKCTSVAEAQAALRTLQDSLGISAAVIHLHPDNDPHNEHLYGAKILGTCVGSNSYIQIALNNYLDELEGVADKLINFPNLQGRMLLFRYCFITKPVHLCRTLPPSTLSQFCEHFERLKRKVLASIVECSSQDIPDLTYDICAFGIAEGGLGLQRMTDISKCGYIASLVEHNRFEQNSIKEELSRFRRGEITELSHHLMSLLSTLQLLKLDLESDEECHDRVFQMSFRAKEGTVQHQLYQQLESKLISNTRLELSNDKQQLTWWDSIRNEEAGQWLLVTPLHNRASMINADFRTALRYRLYMKAYNVPVGLRCTCKNRPAVDERGHHLATHCGAGGYRIATHDSVVHEVNSIFAYCGLWTRLEERLALNPDKQNRPDITVNNPPGNLHRKLFVDVAITGPIQAGSLNHPPGHAASLTYQRKMKKYADLGQPESAVLPVVLQSTGLIHVEFKKYLKKLSYIASESKRIQHFILYRHFLKRISICLQLNIARSINCRSTYLTSHCASKNTDPSYYEVHVRDL
jgi:hypothetical protein